MKTTINFSQFCDAFHAAGRAEQFSYNCKQALYDYLVEYEESTGEEVELDVIALCCEFTEYEDLEDIKRNYEELNGDADYTLDDLRDHTQVIEFDGGIILQDF